MPMYWYTRQLLEKKNRKKVNKKKKKKKEIMNYTAHKIHERTGCITIVWRILTNK